MSMRRRGVKGELTLSTLSTTESNQPSDVQQIFVLSSRRPSLFERIPWSRIYNVVSLLYIGVWTLFNVYRVVKMYTRRYKTFGGVREPYNEPVSDHPTCESIASEYDVLNKGVRVDEYPLHLILILALLFIIFDNMYHLVNFVYNGPPLELMKNARGTLSSLQKRTLFSYRLYLFAILVAFITNILSIYHMNESISKFRDAVSSMSCSANIFQNIQIWRIQETINFVINVIIIVLYVILYLWEKLRQESMVKRVRNYTFEDKLVRAEALHIGILNEEQSQDVIRAQRGMYNKLVQTYRNNRSRVQCVKCRILLANEDAYIQLIRREKVHYKHRSFCPSLLILFCAPCSNEKCVEYNTALQTFIEELNRDNIYMDVSSFSDLAPFERFQQRNCREMRNDERCILSDFIRFPSTSTAIELPTRTSSPAVRGQYVRLPSSPHEQRGSRQRQRGGSVGGTDPYRATHQRQRGDSVDLSEAGYLLDGGHNPSADRALEMIDFDSHH